MIRERSVKNQSVQEVINLFASAGRTFDLLKNFIKNWLITLIFADVEEQAGWILIEGNFYQTGKFYPFAWPLKARAYVVFATAL